MEEESRKEPVRLKIQTTSTMSFPLPGTITIFSKTTCVHCAKAKALLLTKGAAHLSILQLDELDPTVRGWMLEHTVSWIATNQS